MQHQWSLDPCRGRYPHEHETLVLSWVGVFQANWDKNWYAKDVNFLLFGTGTDIDHATVLTTYLYDNTLCCPENRLEGIVMAEKMTIRDIARLAGVSKATVSRVLNQKPDVDPVTRERILRLI